MHIRPMTRADIPACVSIACDAFTNDDMYLMNCPHLREYPDGWRRYHAQRLRQRFIMLGMWGIVCVEDPPNKGGPGYKDEVIGYALWQRISSDATSPYTKSVYLRRNKTLAFSTERLLLALEEAYTFYLQGNPAVDAEAASRFRSSPPPDFDPLYDRWYLNSVCVSPKHQRKGVGAMLVKWGMEQCKEEGVGHRLPPVPATLISSPVGQGLYAKMGYKVVGWSGQELGLLGGAMMVWDADGRWVRAAGVDDEKAMKCIRPIEIVYRVRKEESSPVAVTELE